MDEHIPTLLSSHAAQLSGDIFTVLTKGRLKPSDLGYKEAHDIAVRLHLINTYLDSLPPYWIELDVEQLCHIVLRDLQAITQPARGSTSSSFHLNLSFFKSSFNQKSHLNPETCLITFFKTRIENARNFKASCDNLLGRLAKEDRDADELPESALQQVDIPSKSDDHNDGVFKALQHITQCEPASHQVNSTTASIEIDPQTIRHPARLCLHELPDSLDSASRCILVLVSAINMTLWQEFCLNIQPEIPADANQKLLSQGGFCRILEREITARLFLSFNFDKSLSLLNKTQVLKQILQAGPGESLKNVLRHYDLTPKDKVMLSYAIARSYWQYYDSELMRTKWTSDTIWFMSERESREHNGQLPLCAYLSFPFGISGDITPDVIYEDLLNHRCPRIFDIGVLLLEIGLAKPFRSGNRRDIVAQANLNHKIATDELVELEKREWDGFTNKKYFDRAVKFCLNSENFTPLSRQLKPIRGFRPSTEPMAPSDSRAGILMRRTIFHKNVVRPLAWLAKRGFKAQAGDIAYVDKKPDLSLQKELSNAQIQQESEVLFHSSIVSKAWLNDLKKISELVERKRRQFAVTNPVRIAILDTGLNKDFLTFKTKSGLLKGIVDEEDFVDPCAQTITDTFGHGTFMARLIMECAPGADILVARVAENTKELENSRENIKKAILWAGRTGKADIISMSFGFPYDDQAIREAIEMVQKERQEEIIFLASAGNSSIDDESFPARHSAVISVYATNCHGAFLQSNSASISNGAAVLGTYGDDLPEFIREEFSTTYPEVCQPGSSVATAIMAGISATMLAYTTVLPSIVPFQGILASTCSNVLQRLRTTKGMEEVLCRLVRQDLDHQRLKAVNPRWFWKSRPTDVDRYIAICDTLRNLDGRFPRGSRAG
ncbi:uncharacterized protein TrAFT101_008621 [Trichoderma asperellum]|uniref:Uncharacterized protein n=1 Tax=Trichoderma asperellum (strain ATCC 204424 / CBS 433.97 / NBRC 101777) TaxID=1042311 RepID=A0A2T3ZBV9_TRIA4|nr:hypothetical protein M441DRAFT_57074 [Trichoderma asperellum CBS 433.97]PTB42291.1 hypothetical protein M441DRAFT_57074 [Trichoderma asperellum CBS 433.97]UKZ93712.1 hypothetical protein TrAFT101_008621 [Trichoderma asperellum]